MSTELIVNWERCAGHGLCAALLPDRIGLDEWGYPVVTATAIADTDRRDVRRAVAACPALALRLARQPALT
jgi:ferredoxin